MGLRRKYLKFLAEHIILIKGESVYTITKKNVVDDDSVQLKFDAIVYDGKQNPLKYYMYDVHMYILEHIKMRDSDLISRVKRFIKSYTRFTASRSKPKLTAIYKAIRERMILFAIGNHNWIENEITDIKTQNDFNVNLSETTKSIMRNLSTINWKPLNIDTGTPISVLKASGGFSKSVQLFSRLTTNGENATVKSIDSLTYNVPLMISNVLYYRMGVSDEDFIIFKQTRGKWKKSIETIKNKEVKKIINDIKMEIDITSLSKDYNNIYLMVQMLTDMYHEDQINNVINSMRIKM